MASDDGERRMLFDTRGRRKNVIRVVYATLALLMGASLFVAVGPFNLAELLGDANTSSADKVLEEQVGRLEKRVVNEPQNEQLLLSLTRTQIAAGNAQVEPAEPGEVPSVPPAARADFEAALESWNRYLKQTEEPNPAAAQLVAGTFFRLAEGGGTTYAEVEENVAEAAKAQRIAAEASPSIGTLTTLAIYESFNGNFGAADRAVEEAQDLAATKAEAKAIKEQLAEFRKNAKEFVKAANQASKEEGKANKERLTAPFGGLGGG